MQDLMQFYWWFKKNPPECPKCYLARWVLFHRGGVCSICHGEEPAEGVEGPEVLRSARGWPLFISRQIVKLKDRWKDIHPTLQDFLDANPVEPARISEWVGTPGSREVSELVYAGKVGPFESDYGDSWKYRFLHSGKNQLYWFTKATNWLDEIAPGASLTVRYTVKEHTEYRTTKETRIVRAKRETS